MKRNDRAILGYDNLKEVEYDKTENENENDLDFLHEEPKPVVENKLNKLKELQNKNQEIRNYIDLVSKEKTKTYLLNKNNSKIINDFIKEITMIENNIAKIKQDEERKKLNEYYILKQKIEEFNKYCDILNVSSVELNDLLSKYKLVIESERSD